MSGVTRMLAGVVVMAAAPAMSAAAGVDTVVLQPIKDNTLFSTEATSSGMGLMLFSGRTGSFGEGTRQRAVMAFDVACGGIPAGSTIVSARLSLTLRGASPQGGSETHTLHRLLRDWGEGTSIAPGGMGAPATPDDATWDHTFFPDQFWSSAGGDFDPASSATALVGTSAVTYSWGPTPQMVADVQSWLNAPAGNFGWLLMGNESQLFTAKRFASREWGVPEEQPTLVVGFIPPPCGADLTGDTSVDVVDLLQLLGLWGMPDGDITGDCSTDVVDLLELLAGWGPCR